MRKSSTVAAVQPVHNKTDMDKNSTILSFHRGAYAMTFEPQAPLRPYGQAACSRHQHQQDMGCIILLLPRILIHTSHPIHTARCRNRKCMSPSMRFGVLPSRGHSPRNWKEPAVVWSVNVFTRLKVLCYFRKGIPFRILVGSSFQFPRCMRPGCAARFPQRFCNEDTAIKLYHIPVYLCCTTSAPSYPA